jgi:DnaA-like protein
MSWAMELSPAGFAEMLTDLSYMDRKTGRAYLQLLGYLRRFGSVPAGERALASVLNVTVRFLQEVAWPLLEDRLVRSDDGKRYFSPDVTAANQRRTAAAPAPSEKSKQHQEAAFAKHARARADARAHAERMNSDAKTHAESMRDASETHAKTDTNASSGASGASHHEHAPSLSKEDSVDLLKEDAFSQPTENEGVLEREGARASAGDAAPADAIPHAQAHENDASTHARSHARGIRPIPPVARPIPPDWKPTPKDALAARGRGYDADELADGFLNWHLGKGDLSPDWDAMFRTWMRREKSPPNAKLPQGSIKLPMAGGSPADADPTEDDLDPLAAKLRLTFGATVYRSWLRHMVIGAVDEDGALLVTLPTVFQRDHVRQHFGDRLLAFWRAENPAIRRINLEVAPAERRAADG